MFDSFILFCADFHTGIISHRNVFVLTRPSD
jgi:hypothetical protein